MCQYSSLSIYYPKLLYAIEITFPYQINSHQIFSHQHFYIFCYLQLLFYSDSLVKSENHGKHPPKYS